MTLMLICPSVESTRRMEEMLRSVSGGKVNIVSYSSAPELRLIGFDCDAVIALGMNTKRAGQTFAACSPLDSGFLYIAGEKCAEEELEPLRALGVHIMHSPVGKAALWHDLGICACVPKRIAAMKNENSLLVSRLAEEKIINRAKLVLMEYLKLSEPQAHRYIEKQAMDLQISRAEVAARVLETYEN